MFGLRVRDVFVVLPVLLLSAVGFALGNSGGGLGGGGGGC